MYLFKYVIVCILLVSTYYVLLCLHTVSQDLLCTVSLGQAEFLCGVAAEQEGRGMYTCGHTHVQ